MSIQVEPYEAVKSSRFKELAGLCRKKFSSGHLKELEDWTYLLTAQKDGRVASFLLLDLDPYDTHDPVAMVRILCAGEKGTGLPQQLLTKAGELAKAAGKTHLELELEDFDEKLIAVYTAVGFSHLPQDEYRMRKPVGGSRVKKQTRRTQRKRQHTVRK